METKTQEQYTKIPHSLMSSKNLTDQDKTTLGIILSFINNDKECYIGNDRLGDMLGISRKAASKRVQRLESIGCIKLNYTYKPNTKLVDKRYITFISIEPQVSPDSGQGVSHQETGVSHEETGYLLTDDTVSPDRRQGVSPKGGSIKQPSLLNNLKNNVLDKLPHNELNKEKPELDYLIEVIKENIEDDLQHLVIDLITGGGLTRIQKDLIFENKSQLIKKIPILKQYI